MTAMIGSTIRIYKEDMTISILGIRHLYISVACPIGEDGLKIASFSPIYTSPLYHEPSIVEGMSTFKLTLGMSLNIQKS